MTTREQQQQTGLSRRQRQSMPSMLTNPFGFMRRFGEGMEQLFDEAGFGGLMPRGFDQMNQWTPQIEMYEREGQLHIRADLPGMNKDDVQIEVEDDAVILRGERRDERREEREGMYRREFLTAVFIARFHCRTTSTRRMRAQTSATACCRSRCR